VSGDFDQTHDAGVAGVNADLEWSWTMTFGN